MLLPHNKVSGGVQDSQIMIPSFFDRFYVMPPLTNGVHYKNFCTLLCDKISVQIFFSAELSFAEPKVLCI